MVLRDTTVARFLAKSGRSLVGNAEQIGYDQLCKCLSEVMDELAASALGDLIDEATCQPPHVLFVLFQPLRQATTLAISARYSLCLGGSMVVMKPCSGSCQP